MPNPKTVRDLESRTAREKEMAAGPSVPEPDDKHGSTAQVATSRSDAGGSIQIADRIKELRRVRARDLLPNPKNWRRHPKAQIDALRGLLAEVGYADALLVRQLPDGRLMLIDGHLRAETTPDVLVPVLLLDVSEEEADKILLTLDPLAAMAESDAQRIAALLQTVRTESPAVEELLRRTAGDRLWEILHPDEVREVEVSLDKADELRRKWHTGAGQLWRVGPHRMICGDCTDESQVARLWSQEKFPARLIWTDPPYGVSYAEKNRVLNRSDRGKRIQKPITNDHLSEAQTGTLLRDGLVVASKYCEPGACVYVSVPGGRLLVRFISALEAAGFAFKSTLVWVKNQFVIGMSDYHFRHELVLYGWLNNGAHHWDGDRSQDSVFEVDRPRASDLHPTTKPVELIARMVANSSRPGELVYDPFCGSGSTIVAAHQLGRIGFGCEIDPAYLAVELERLSRLGLRAELVDE
jgi:DNA modification methylase